MNICLHYFNNEFTYMFFELVQAQLVPLTSIFSRVPAVGHSLMLRGMTFWLETCPQRRQGLQVDVTPGDLPTLLSRLWGELPARLGGELQTGCFPSWVLSELCAVTQGPSPLSATSFSSTICFRNENATLPVLQVSNSPLLSNESC